MKNNKYCSILLFKTFTSSTNVQNRRGGVAVKRLLRTREVGDRPKSLKQVLSALLQNARQQA